MATSCSLSFDSSTDFSSVRYLMTGTAPLPNDSVVRAMALWPGNSERMERWRQGHSPKAFRGAMKQINRFLDDLEKRYPRNSR